MLIVPNAIVAGLWPPFARAVGTLQAQAALRGLSAAVPAGTGGYRSLDDQARLYAIGRNRVQVAQRVRMQGRNGAVTDAPPGSSAHNWGLAIDVEGRDQAAVVRLAKAMGFATVTWDPAHIEYPDWMTLVRAYGFKV